MASPFAVSQRDCVEDNPSPGQTADAVPRFEPRCIPSSSSDSIGNLASTSSSSEECKESGGSPPQSLPSYYSPGSLHRFNCVEDSDSKHRSASTRGAARGWRRHLVGWRVVLLDSWLNVLLFFIPAAWTIRLVMEDEYVLIFSFCILALIPLVRLHDITIAQLALRIGGSKTALLNASMSNFVEIVLAISAMRKCELRVVQSSLVGSILSKLLLILGLCFFAGGLRFSEQGFNPTATQVHSSLLSISVAVLLLPAAYHFTLSGGVQNIDVQKRDILKMSHGVSIVMMLIYLSYLAFQLWSHTHLYRDNHDKTSMRLPATRNISAEKTAAYLSARSRSTFQSCKNLADLDNISLRGLRSPPLGRRGPRSVKNLGTPKMPCVPDSIATSRIRRELSFSTAKIRPDLDDFQPLNRSVFADQNTSTIELVEGNFQNSGVPPKNEERKSFSTPETLLCTSPKSSSDKYGQFGGLSEKLTKPTAMQTRATSESGSDGSQQERRKSRQKKEPQLSWFLTITLMLIVTAAVTITADWLVESMDGISSIISKEWVALILLPAVSSIAECVTAIRVSVRDELSLSVSVAVGSTIQTALFVIPFMVMLGWATGKPLTLLMDPFESLVLFLTVQTTGYVLADGKSNWLEGFILISLYSIIAVSFWFYPGSTPLDFLTVCPR